MSVRTNLLAGTILGLNLLIGNSVFSQWTNSGSNITYTTRDYVGININSPAATLHVKDAASTKPAIFIEGAGSTEGDITWKKGEALQIGEWDLSKSTFKERLTIRSNGRVGINTSAPEATLAIKQISDSRPALLLEEGTKDLAWLNGQNFQIGTWNKSTNKFGLKMILKSDGNVGIGTENTNDGARLNVQGDIRTTGGIFMASSFGDKISLYGKRFGSTSMYGFGIESNTLYSKSFGGYRWYIKNNANGGTSAAMFLNSKGQVGIGTQDVNTTARLSVAGDIRTTGRIFTAKEVGIGTENMLGFKLAVAGKIHAEEIVVEANWADFVFEDNYNLRSLNEVENFIEINGHLPEIPSAKEVEKNGVTVGEMESKLLMKVEELTLYVIQLRKELDQIKNQVK